MHHKKQKTYLNLCTQYYDLENHKDTDIAVAYYKDLAIKAQGAVLEPMCGTGRFLIPLLQDKIDVEGFDASEYMLEALNQKYKAICGKAAPIWRQFIQDFKSKKIYKLIFIPYGSWCLISDIIQAKNCLKIMYDHLAFGGKFVIEIETISSVVKCGVWQRSLHKRAENSYIALNTFCRFDLDSQKFNALCRYESIINNQIESLEVEDFEMYLYKFNELDKMLWDVGFKKINKYQDYFYTNAEDPNIPLIIYHCTK